MQVAEVFRSNRVEIRSALIPRFGSIGQPLAAVPAFGWLVACFLPSGAGHLCHPAFLRYRTGLVAMAICQVRHMQKVLDQTNLQLHHVISEITGRPDWPLSMRLGRESRSTDAGHAPR